jgi:hypothetical protein
VASRDFTPVSFLAYSSTLKMEVTCSSETSVSTFSGLHGIISQKIELFITTAVRTSNPTETVGRDHQGGREGLERGTHHTFLQIKIKTVRNQLEKLKK